MKPRPTAEQPAQTLVAAAQPEFPSGEAHRRVVQTNVTGRDQHFGWSRSRSAKANLLGAAIEEKTRDLQALQREIDNLTGQKGEEERAAKDDWDAYEAFNLTLARIGAQVPPPVDPQAHLATSQGDVNGHAAQFGGPAFPDDPAAGPCINCGVSAWKAPASPIHPKGATHSFGATCDPNADNPTYADLGEQRAEQ